MKTFTEFVNHLILGIFSTVKSDRILSICIEYISYFTISKIESLISTPLDNEWSFPLYFM